MKTVNVDKNDRDEPEESEWVYLKERKKCVTKHVDKVLVFWPYLFVVETAYEERLIFVNICFKLFH